MPWWLAPAIAGGSRIAGELLGGGRDVSPELSQLIEQIKGMMEEGLPEEEIGRISAPYVRLRKGIEQTYARRAGASGIKAGVIQQEVTTPLGEAIGAKQEQFRTGLLGILGRLQMGAERFRRPTDWGRILGGAGAGFGQAYAGMEEQRAEEEEWEDIMGFLEQYLGGRDVVPSIGGKGRMSSPGYGGKPEGWWD